MSVQVANFEKSMAFTLFLPTEIDFGDEDPKCYLLTGNNETLSCVADRKNKTLFFRGVYNFFDANPGTISIMIDKLKNPVKNVVTKSFAIVTQTYDGYSMDKIAEGISINFYCEYPCA